MALTKFNQIELVELRFLQQGQEIQYSDGNDWMRVAVGVITTVLAVLIAAVKIESGLLVVIVMVLGLGSTVAWIMRAGAAVATARRVELDSRFVKSPALEH